MPLESPQEQFRRYVLSLEARIQALEGQVAAQGDDMFVPVGKGVAEDTAALQLQFAARMSGDVVKVRKGYRQIIGFEPVLLAPGSGDEFEFTFVDGGAVWSVFTYRTTESGLGTWDTTLQTGTSIPADSQSQRVFIVCRMATVSGVSKVYQEHVGPMPVYDILNRSACA